MSIHPRTYMYIIVIIDKLSIFLNFSISNVTTLEVHA